MRVGSLFTGYGGLDAAIPGDLAWYSEIDEAACRVLTAHHGDTPNLGDVTRIDWATVPPVDVLTAGYPCQPFSPAGHRKGTNDDRHLWPYVADAIRHLRPRWVVLENVYGHLTLGLDVVLADLARMGFDARWGVVRASDAGAPHRRARLFIVAHAADTTSLATQGASDLPAGRLPGESGRSAVWGDYGAAVARWERITGRPAPDPATDGRVSPRFVEWMMGLPDGWVTGHGLSATAELKMLGNGVVPQQARLALDLLGAA